VVEVVAVQAAVFRHAASPFLGGELSDGAGREIHWFGMGID
jgi:hypothetical protein